MADVPGASPNQVQDWGNLMTSFGQGLASTNSANASASLANAQTGLVGQQTQAAALQNQLQRARQTAILKALQDYNMQSDDSGAAPSGGNGNGIQATPGTTGSPVPNPNGTGTAVPGQPAAPVTPQNWYDPARVDAGLRARYFVNPAGTPQEMQALAQASMIDPTGTLGPLSKAKMDRQNGVDSRLAASQNDANELYETMTNGVVNAPTGRALDALEAVSPQAAANIRKMIPDSLDEDTAARAFATHVANNVHQYSGRKVVLDASGTPRDETTGNEITGSTQTPLSKDQLLQFVQKSNELVDVKMQDGTIQQKPRWAAPGGAPTQQAYIAKLADLAGIPGASPSITGAPRAQFQQAAKSAIAAAPPPTPAQPRVAAPGATAPVPTAPGAPGPGTVAPGRPSTPAAGASAMQSRLLPGPDGSPVNLDAMPKAVFPAAQPGTPNPQQQAQIDAYKDNYKQIQTDSMRKLQETNQADALLTPFQQRLNSVNARDVGPGSKAYAALLDMKTAITGAAPDDLVDMGVLDKFANQLGVQNVRQLLSGQRITNQEMMNFLTRASASVTQPLDVMKTIVSYQKANNDFDRRLATTQLAGLAKHVDPAALQGLENGRTQYVENQMTKDGFPATGAGTTGAAKTYATPEAVKADFQAGKITRAQATQILQTQHGMQ